jgi:hypothetical protein
MFGEKRIMREVSSRSYLAPSLFEGNAGRRKLRAEVKYANGHDRIEQVVPRGVALIASKQYRSAESSEANFCVLEQFSMPILCAVPLNRLCLVSGISAFIPDSFTLQVVVQTSWLLRARRPPSSVVILA